MVDRYLAQVRLLVDVLPDVAAESAFALKGGTAINLFYRDMLRLSIDIDLTWLPISDRSSSLREMDSALDRIATSIVRRNAGISARRRVASPRARGKACASPCYSSEPDAGRERYDSSVARERWVRSSERGKAARMDLGL